MVPHASLRQLLLVPEVTNGRGAAKVWRPCTPAMAAGLTDHVWSLTEGLFYRVSPWPQAQTVKEMAPVEHHEVKGLSVLKSRLRGVNEG